MKILQVHNFYQQPGGEDQVFNTEGELLAAQGNEVVRYTRHNDDVNHLNWITAATATLWCGASYRELRQLIRRERPAIAHVHNTFPLISPAVYYAARAEGVPVVQTLHNYRLICPNAILFRSGHVCEDCLGRLTPWPGVANGCYRGSRLATGVTAAMLGLHRALRTWQRQVSVYICMTEFARSKFTEAGIPRERIVVKPHFVRDPGVGTGDGGYAMFVGRLTAEKGVETLLRAWRRLGGRLDLKIIGDGPLGGLVARSARSLPGLEWLGQIPPEHVFGIMKQAACLVVPSEWYETFGRVAIESFAVGTPVIAANIGAIGELVEEGRTGLHFRPGDDADLAARVEDLLSSPPKQAAMRVEARRTYEAKYTPEQNYKLLKAAYAQAREGGAVQT